MKVKILLVVVALLFLSCLALDTPDIEGLPKWPTRNLTYSTRTIFLDGLTQTEIHNTIEEAFEAWEATGAVTLTYKEYASHITVSTKDLEGTTAGETTEPPYGNIRLDTSNRQWTKSLLYRVMLHEIGHALGLNHSVGRDSVMYKRIQAYTSITTWDKELINKLYETTP